MAISVTINDTTIHTGDTVRVHYKIIEKDIVAGKTKKEKHEEQKERLQVFEGMVIAIRGTASGQSFIVRRLGVGGVGIERIFPVISPWIKKIEVKRFGDVRRAKLYYLRTKTKKEIARIATSATAKAKTLKIAAASKAVANEQAKATKHDAQQPVQG